MTEIVENLKKGQNLTFEESKSLFSNLMEGKFDETAIIEILEALIKKGVEKSDFEINEGWEKWLLDMVGIATLSDMVPLVGENRVFAKYGLMVLRKSPRPGLQKLLRKAGINQRFLSEEDILAMNNKAVNPGWGPRGADTYSCWLFKGGGNCGHWWSKELYISAKGFGLDLNNPNVQKKAWSMAEKAGYKIRNNYLVEQRPIDMPYNGFLPDNPRFAIK